MSSSRTPSIYYQISLKKEALEGLRYGRRFDGSRAPCPIFKAWDQQTFLSRALTIKPTATHTQVLIPTAVEESTSDFLIKGYLLSGPGELNEAFELETFIKNKEHRKLADHLYEFFDCYCELSFLNKPKLFQPQAQGRTQKEAILAFLQEKTKASFSKEPGEWHYNAEKKTAWVIYNSEECLKEIAADFKNSGFPEANIEMSKVEKSKQPILILRNFDSQKLKDMQEAKFEPSYTPG
jgi:hypothetical protein